VAAAFLAIPTGGVLKSQPRSGPKTRLKRSVSQKWVRATLAGINKLGNRSAVVQAAKNNAVAVAASDRATLSMRISGYMNAT
jgi:hypothetical protein